MSDTIIENENETENGSETVEPTGDETLNEVEAEKSDEDKIADAIREENVRIGEEEDPVKGAAALWALAQKGIELAGGPLMDALKRVDTAAGRVADVMALLRQNIITATGPDWWGGSAAYKAAVSPIIEAAIGPNETKATAANRLQKATVRRLGFVVAHYVADRDGITFGDDPEKSKRAIDALVRKGIRVSPSEMGDESISALVTAVNREYGANDPDRPTNRPLSPFESKPSRQPGSSSDENKAVKVAESMPDFVKAVGTVTIERWVPEVLRVAKAAFAAVSKDEVHFGDLTREDVALALYASAVILNSTGRKVLGKDFTDKQNEDLAAALKYGEPVNETVNA